MKGLKHLLAAGLLVTPAPALAQTSSGSDKSEEVLISGSRAGQQLGQAGFLLRQVARPDAPLRIALLPPVMLDKTTLSADFMQRTYSLLSQARPELIWQQVDTLPDPITTPSPSPPASPAANQSPIPSVSPAVSASPMADGELDGKASASPASPSPASFQSPAPQTSPSAALPFNRQIMQLADQNGVDMALGIRIQAVARGYWVLTSLYSGADGSILRNRKLTIARLEPEELAQALSKELEAIDPPPVNDLAAAGTELHLRSTPPELHAYLDDVPVGLTPLILRQIPPGQHQLRLFEPEPYLIERIRIISDPPGVMVKVNERELGRTPLDFPAELMIPGRYDIELSSESRDRFEAQIQVQTKPDNIPVQLDQLPVRRTPVTFQELAQNRYSLYLSPNRAIDLNLPLDLSAGQIHTRQIDAYKYAKLIVTSNIGNTQVTLDNEVVGETPYAANLAQGSHSISVGKNRYRTQAKAVVLGAGETQSLHFELRPRSADTSIFLTPTAELTPQFNIGAKYLTFGNLTRNNVSELGHIYGAEVDYGWPELWRFANTFDLGLEVGGFLYALQTPSLLRSFQGVGAKLQFLRESDTIPISAALGGYVNIDLNRPKLVGYVSLSRNFGDFALHLGIQTHGFNINFGYTGWENIRLGLLLYADSFLRLLAEPGEQVSTFYGIQAGYSF